MSNPEPAVATDRHKDPAALLQDLVRFETVNPPGDERGCIEWIDDLLSAALREARRVASRCIVVGDRPWARTASAAGWTTEAAFQRPVHRSLTRYVLVLRRS